MLITGITVEGVGKFHRAASVRGLGPGVNVLAAGNEAGKSTVFRAVRTCLFKRHNSNDQDIRNLACAEVQLPCYVALAFEHAGHSYEIRKTFVRSVSASLWENGREIARGRDADEKVWELFGIGAGSGRTIDDGAFGLLWVGQGQSISVPAITGKADALVTAAIEAEVGNLVGGERARTVLGELNSQIGTYLTKAGRVASDGPLGAAERAFAELSAEETALDARVKLLEVHFTEVAALKVERTRLNDPAAIRSMNDDLANNEKALKAGQEALSAVKTYENQERVAYARLETAGERLSQLKGMIERIETLRSRETQLSPEIESLIAQESIARANVESTKAQIVKFDDEISSLDSRRQLLQQLSGAIAKAEKRRDQEQKLATLETAATRLIGLNAQLDQFGITPVLLKIIDNAERQLTSLTAQLAAAAPQVLIEVAPKGRGQVQLGEKSVDARLSGPVLAATKITVADLATITVTPASSDARNYENNRRKFDDELNKALRKAKVMSPAEAAAAMAQRRDLEAQRQGVLAELKALGGDTVDPTILIADLKQQIANIAATIRGALDQAELADLPESSAVEAERISNNAEREELLRRRARLVGIRDEQDTTLVSAASRRSGVEAELAEIRRSLQTELALCPDVERPVRLSELSKAVDDATVIHRQTAAALVAQQALAPEQGELERLENRCRRLREQAENRQARLSELGHDIARLEGQIENAGGDGIGESLASTKELREVAERDRARHSNRLAALQLLRKTVDTCLAEGQERYYAPVRRHLRPFLNDLFPGAELQLGDGFGIEGLKRGGDQAEPFTRLSDGTQEQIAILVRLAMGAMLTEQGQPTPIILDDALVFSDDDRITRMFDALSRAGQNQQIVVLTCRTRAFEQLGGRSVRIEAGGSIA
jgi:hypothetical protein